MQAMKRILQAPEAHALSSDPINIGLPTLLLHSVKHHKKAPVQENHDGRVDDCDENDIVHEEADQKNVRDEGLPDDGPEVLVDDRHFESLTRKAMMRRWQRTRLYVMVM